MFFGICICYEMQNFIRKSFFSVCNAILAERGAKATKIQKDRDSLLGGLANRGLRYLSTIVHDCLKLTSFCAESSP